MTPFDVEQMLRPLSIKDYRIQCRQRNLSPAGCMDTLKERVMEHMFATGDFTLRTETGDVMNTGANLAGVSSADVAEGFAKNNYVRSAGQNVGNFLTDRNSSHVLAPPGGVSQICFGDDSTPAPARAHQAAPLAPKDNQVHSPMRLDAFGGYSDSGKNNYARPGGQNVGNFLTDRNSSRVLAPPGGRSQIHFG